MVLGFLLIWEFLNGRRMGTDYVNTYHENTISIITLSTIYYNHQISQQLSNLLSSPPLLISSHTVSTVSQPQPSKPSPAQCKSHPIWKGVFLLLCAVCLTPNPLPLTPNSKFRILDSYHALTTCFSSHAARQYVGTVQTQHIHTYIRYTYRSSSPTPISSSPLFTAHVTKSISPVAKSKFIRSLKSPL